MIGDETLDTDYGIASIILFAIVVRPWSKDSHDVGVE